MKAQYVSSMLTAEKIHVGTVCVGELHAPYGRDVCVPCEHMPMRKRIILALDLLFRGRVTIPGPRL